MKKVTEINLRVGDAIRKGLQRKGMTQKELAALVGSTQRSISSYINGNAQPPLDILSLICRILEINMDLPHTGNQYESDSANTGFQFSRTYAA